MQCPGGVGTKGLDFTSDLFGTSAALARFSQRPHGIGGWVSFTWSRSLANFRLGSFAGTLVWDLALGIFRSGDTASDLSLRNYRLDAFTWDDTCGIVRLETVRLGTLIRELVELSSKSRGRGIGGTCSKCSSLSDVE